MSDKNVIITRSSQIEQDKEIRRLQNLGELDTRVEIEAWLKVIKKFMANNKHDYFDDPRFLRWPFEQIAREEQASKKGRSTEFVNVYVGHAEPYPYKENNASRFNCPIPKGQRFLVSLHLVSLTEMFGVQVLDELIQLTDDDYDLVESLITLFTSISAKGVFEKIHRNQVAANKYLHNVVYEEIRLGTVAGVSKSAAIQAKQHIQASAARPKIPL